MKELGDMGKEGVGLEGGVGEEGDGVGGERRKVGHLFVVEVVEDLVKLLEVVDGDGGSVHNRFIFWGYIHNIDTSPKKFNKIPNFFYFFIVSPLFSMYFSTFHNVKS